MEECIGYKLNKPNNKAGFKRKVNNPGSSPKQVVDNRVLINVCLTENKEGNLAIVRQPRSQGLFPGLGVGREKALGLAGHMISEQPNILGVLNYHMLNGTFKMAVLSSEPKFLSVLRRVGFSLNNGNFPPLNLKPLQWKCFEYILKGQDVNWSPIYWIWQVNALSPSTSFYSREDHQEHSYCGMSIKFHH